MRRSERPGEPLRVALFAYPDLQALDFSGPLEMFARATRLLRDEGRAHPGYSLAVVGAAKGPIAASSGFRFLPDTTFASLRCAGAWTPCWWWGAAASMRWSATAPSSAGS